ncbi:unnamed protein product, partial [Rotaria magnacalcarata]
VIIGLTELGSTNECSADSDDNECSGDLDDDEYSSS